MRIEDAVVLITGASEGIGAACAKLLGARGARLALTARSADRLRTVARPDDLIIPADLTDEGARTRAVDQTLERFGRLDILLNNAGVGLFSPPHIAPMEETRRMFELNFFAPLRLIQLAAPHMREQGAGTIVNVSSIGGLITLPWLTLYSASKFAVTSLTDGLRSELRRDGVQCMTVFPGYVRTGFQTNVLAGVVPPALGGLKQRWSVSAEECAEAIVKGLESDARTVVTPRTGWLLIALHRLAPRLVERKLEEMYFQRGMPS